MWESVTIPSALSVSLSAPQKTWLSLTALQSMSVLLLAQQDSCVAQQMLQTHRGLNREC